MEDKDNKMREEIFSKSVRAGRRTYFFDVRATRAEDYYMTITESKRHTKEDGSFYYQKHKIYLYKEDFDSFIESLKEVSDFVIKEKGREVITLDSTEKSDLETSSVEEDKVDDKESTQDDKESTQDDNSESQSSDLKFEDI
tara:strand:+ start:506 stop:928 length:423 start_codon:yes stop_codon:yes gene_type:complete